MGTGLLFVDFPATFQTMPLPVISISNCIIVIIRLSNLWFAPPRWLTTKDWLRAVLGIPRNCIVSPMTSSTERPLLCFLIIMLLRSWHASLAHSSRTKCQLYVTISRHLRLRAPALPSPTALGSLTLLSTSAGHVYFDEIDSHYNEVWR